MSSSTTDAKFACRVVVCDHYSSPPLKNFDPTTSIFRESTVKTLPVLRIFGSTPAGQKCCLHVHGFFPYFYVPSPAVRPTEEFLRQLAVAIDAALNSSFESGRKDKKNDERQYVYAISPFYGIPFYGYHDEETLFLKISFYNPQILKRAGELMQSGAIMNTIFQPYELHVSYEMKFFIDFDLYGMDLLLTKDVKFRYKENVSLPKERSSDSPEDILHKVWNLNELENYRLPLDVQRMSTCELEADCLVSDIIRTNGNNTEGIQNPGLRFLWKDEITRRKSMNIDGLPAVAVSQDRVGGLMLPNEIAQFEMLTKLLDERGNESFVETAFPEAHQSQLDASNRSDVADTSARNLSLASDRSAVNAFADLLVDRSLADANGEGQEMLDDDQFSEHSQIRSDDEEDEEEAARESIEMSRKIEEFSDSDDENALEGFRIQQVDGPPGDVDEDGENQDLDEHEDKSNALSVTKDIGKNRQWTLGYVSDDSMDSDETPFTRLRQREDEKKATAWSKPISLLTSTIKPPSKKEIKIWLADHSRKRVSRRSVDDDVQRRDDIDAVHLEEIQARLSPEEESFMMSGASNSVAVDNGRVTPIANTPEATSANPPPSSRRTSKGTVTFSDRKKRRSGAVRGRRLVLSQPVERPMHDEIVFASARDQIHDSSSVSLDEFRASKTAIPVKTRRRAKQFSLHRTVRGALLRSDKKPKKLPAKVKKAKRNVSELDAPSVFDSFGFNSSEFNLIGAQITPGGPCFTVMSLEIHADTRYDLRPDPEFDSIGALFYALYIDDAIGQRMLKGAIILCPDDVEKQQTTFLRGFDKFHCTPVDSELALFDALIGILRKFDPDILVGYEIQLLSWGFAFERAQFLGVNLCSRASRIPEYPKQSRFSLKDEYWSMADVHVAGRIVLNLSRVLRHEITLYIYTFENVVYNVLRQRVPSYEFRTLTQWFSSMKTRWRVFDYYFTRVVSEIEIINRRDLLNRTSELARLYGIQFFEVLSRGSQFRVESMLLRMARTRNYVALSPSVRQRNRMAAPECIALTMEPESRFYTEPVLVLDFQSLYPSMVIAYNYCYSTCLGRIRHYASSDVIEFGCYKLRIPTSKIKSLLDKVTISPNGVAFAKTEVRRGIMPQMLEEILNSRVMVKNSARLCKNDKALQRILDARQYGLKMIANVTYGYTAATFSGRMPCTEISDSIVQKGRETLLRAMDLVNGEAKWNARVVYGDTDSLFVLLPGRTKDEAFKIGREICDAVTAQNPTPVKLKFEKVYYPCVLQTKKRYVGYAYETADQKEPVFDAKGIETVRRDACPAAAKILQKALETLFVTKEISTVRQYVVRQFQRIHHGRASPLDFLFSRKYRGRENYKANAAAPILLIARRRLQKDRRAEPRIKERVPYLIVAGPPGSTLISCVREPSDFITQRGLRLNYRYYITKQICAALNRVFCLVNVDTLQWYHSMPRSDRALYGFGLRGRLLGNQEGLEAAPTISQYFQVRECAVCRNVTARGDFCVECEADAQRSTVEVLDRIRCVERRRDGVHRLCNVCLVWPSTCGSDPRQSIECTSIVCPVTYKRSELDFDLDQALQLRRLVRDT